jgi:lipopolysaccharide export system permease protein
MLSFWLTPKLMAYRQQLLAQTGTAIELDTLLPGRFQQTNGGQQIFYVESMSTNKQRMQNIFMAQMDTANNAANPAITPWIILNAESGAQMIDKKTGDRFFVATQGRRYQGVPGSKDFQLVQFGEYRIRIEKHVTDIGAQQNALSTSALWHSTKNKADTAANKADAASELQWRVSAPLSVLLLALLAIPLSQVKPRHGRYAALLPAILIYIIYVNLLVLGRDWIEQRSISPALGLWWIHGLLLLAIILIWLRQMGISSIRAMLAQYARGNA